MQHAAVLSPRAPCSIALAEVRQRSQKIVSGHANTSQAGKPSSRGLHLRQPLVRLEISARKMARGSARLIDHRARAHGRM